MKKMCILAITMVSLLFMPLVANAKEEQVSPCYECGGSGVVSETVYDEEYGIYHKEDVTCPSCGGSGYF